MENWTVIEPKDQDRIWSIALALMSQSPQQGGPTTLVEALQRACAEYYAARKALFKGLRFYEFEDGEEQLRRVRGLENGTWIKEKSPSR
ncbi:MAG: hypothetical protein EA397_02935 [Deltaproteobacteria bacterium]|nr:MAG: hypothetical protein EA397_02935 [Deltaproteobacteria bacterium]